MVQFLEGRNRAWAQFNAPINGSDTNVALVAWQGSRLSDVTTASGRKVRAQIYERDADTGAITKCELVDITNNVSDVLIIERTVESTRATDTTNTYAATPQSFTANAIIEEVITSEVLSEIQDEVNRLEEDKLDKSVYDAERVVYGASSAWDDDYEILTGDSLATVADGRIFAVRADVANTGASTLKVDATSPVALKKISWGAFADLATWDIIANQIFFAMKNTAASCYQFSLDPATLSLTVPDADTATKGIVELSTESEYQAWTGWLVPTNDLIENYWVNTNIKSAWHTIPCVLLKSGANGFFWWSWDAFNSASLGNLFHAYMQANSTSTVSMSASIPWFSGTNYIQEFRIQDGKGIRLKWWMCFNDTTNRKAFWLCVTRAAMSDDQTSVTNGTYRFLLNGSTLYTHIANGTVATIKDVSSGINLLRFNEYEIEIMPTYVKFYINGTEVESIATNLPTTGTLLMWLWFQSSGSTRDLWLINPVISIQR